ncbi:hypothetical protein V6N13_111053 [Hibiscus sabdariffa]
MLMYLLGRLVLSSENIVSLSTRGLVKFGCVRARTRFKSYAIKIYAGGDQVGASGGNRVDVLQTSSYEFHLINFEALIFKAMEAQERIVLQSLAAAGTFCSQYAGSFIYYDTHRCGPSLESCWCLIVSSCLKHRKMLWVSILYGHVTGHMYIVGEALVGEDTCLVANKERIMDDFMTYMDFGGQIDAGPMFGLVKSLQTSLEEQEPIKLVMTRPSFGKVYLQIKLSCFRVRFCFSLYAYAFFMVCLVPTMNLFVGFSHSLAWLVFPFISVCLRVVDFIINPSGFYQYQCQ